MARRRRPFPDSVAVLDEYDKSYGGLGMGAYVPGAPVSPAKEDIASLTRAQRDALSSRARRSIGLREKPGRPGEWGPSGHKLDGILVERVIHLLVEEPDLKVQTATERVRLALLDEPHFDERQWMENGWLSDGAKAAHPLDDDVERIAGKVRDALVGDPSITDAKERQGLIDAELERLRRNWMQLKQVRDDRT